MKYIAPFVLILINSFFCSTLQGQIDSANDAVPEITSDFLFGVNPGYYDGWDDEGLADIGFGNASKGIPGAGLQTLRGYLPEWFLEQWGYAIRVDEYEYFEELGGKEFTVTIGYPAEEHQENTSYCADHQSEVFENLYLPIWDDGENGTPVHDENFYALYIYKLVTGYKDFIKIYEVWNEPDFDLSGNGYKDPGEPGNWWENIPEPCDTRLRAPIYSYIRMLRIAYEVIKSVDPEALIAVGGLGYASYLDLICRHSDNPENGVVNSDYPLLGGAWFDVLSYHSYPHFDGSLRDWNNDINDFEYFRHSDAAVEGLYEKKSEFEAVLNNYQYNDNTYPKKHFIITESNIPRAPFDEYIGSNEAQINFVMKSMLTAPLNEVRQFHIYKQAEDKSPGQYADSFDAMGLFENLDDVDTDDFQITDAGIASATVTKLTENLSYDWTLTQSLTLPPTVNGAVFRQGNAVVTALWAKTTIDQSEMAQASYQFPASFSNNLGQRAEWDFSRTDVLIDQPLTGMVNLSGRPSFFTNTLISTTSQLLDAQVQLKVMDNPGTQPQIVWQQSQSAQLEIYDYAGHLIFSKSVDSSGALDFAELPWPLNSGIYLVQLESAGIRLQEKVVWLES